MWTKEPYHKITIDDAEFEFIDKEVEVLASTESWVAGEKDPDCPSIDPNDCRIFHYRKDPAIARKIPVSIVKIATSSQKTKIKGNYKLVKRNVEVSPATTAVETIPAITEQISRKVVVTDEATKVISVAAEYINVTKATQIIFGIVLSVFVAFSVGAIVQYFSRFLLSYNYEQKAKWVGSVFGGVALTSITYFILMKGIKGTAYAKQSFDILNGSTIANFMETQVMLIALTSFILLSAFSYILIFAFKINIYRFICIRISYYIFSIKL